MTTFALKGNQEEKLHGSHSSTPLELRGHFYAQGPQPISALPAWIVQAFQDIPEITQIAINTENHAVVYQRMEQP